MKSKITALFTWVLFLANSAAAQELIRTLPLTQARLMTTDKSGNVYVVGEDNGLVRYDLNGDSTGNFRSIQNGDLMWVDATNPLKILLNYPAFSKIVILDRMLAPKNELDFKKLSLYNPVAVGIAVDGNTWVYDPLNARLKKIDDQLNVTNSSNDMRIESQTVPLPQSLIERENNVYLCDPVHGLFVFDRFGTYKNILEIKGVDKVQLIDNQLIYKKADTLYAYHLNSFLLKSIPLPSKTGLIDARIERNRLYFLFRDKLEIYQMPHQ